MSSVRKSFVSKRYSPTTSAISSFSAAGYVYFALERRGEEAPDHDAVQRARRIAARDAESTIDEPPGARDVVPQARLLDRRRHGDEAAVVRVVGAVAEAVDAEVARRLRRHHAGPGRNRDRRDHRRQPAVRAALHEARDRRQLVAPALEDERRLGAVEPDEHDLARHARSVATRPARDRRDRDNRRDERRSPTRRRRPSS